MAYWHDYYVIKNVIEHEYKYAGKYGAKGEKRAEKKKATQEQIARQNQRNKENNMRRLILANFDPYDLWSCLKYQAGVRKTLKKVKEDLSKFIRKLRNEYKKIGEELKFIYRLELGEYGGSHIHILVNRLRGETNTDILMQKIWNELTDGNVDWKSLYEQGGYRKLAEYIVKQPEKESEEYEQLSLLPKEERKEYIKYSTSRNLIRPKPKRKTYSHTTMRKILRDGIKPVKGYYVDPDSIESGINPYTGMSYLRYTEYRLESNKGNEDKKSRGKP